MRNNEITRINYSFLESVSKVLENARKNAKTAVNPAMVYAYYEIGRMIIEEEQHGENSATYGRQVLEELSKYLTEIFGKGFSVTNLKQMRQFDSVLYRRLVLSMDKDDALVELSLPKNSNIYTSGYQLYLPNRQMLQEKLEEWMNETGNTDDKTVI